LHHKCEKQANANLGMGRLGEWDGIRE